MVNREAPQSERRANLRIVFLLQLRYIFEIPLILPASPEEGGRGETEGARWLQPFCEDMVMSQPFSSLRSVLPRQRRNAPASGGRQPPDASRHQGADAPRSPTIVTNFPAGVIVIVLSALFGLGAVDAAAPGAQPSLNDLSMEVAALQVLHDLRLTATQLQTVRRLAKETVPEESTREVAKASAEFRRTLMDMRDVLVADDDEERIDKLLEQLEELGQKEKPELDDAAEVTEEARRQAPQLVGLLERPSDRLLPGRPCRGDSRTAGTAHGSSGEGASS